MSSQTKADTVVDILMYIIMFGFVLVSFYIWVVKVWPTDAVPDLSGVAALVAVLPVSEATRYYLKTRARKLQS